MYRDTHTHFSNFWIKGKDNQFKYFGNRSIHELALAFLNIFENITDIHIDSNNIVWIIDDNFSIYRMDNGAFSQFSTINSIRIRSIRTTDGGKWLPLKNIELPFSENALQIRVFSPSYLHANSNLYQYIKSGSNAGSFSHTSVSSDLQLSFPVFIR